MLYLSSVSDFVMLHRAWGMGTLLLVERISYTGELEKSKDI